jgi:hypothetical protein
MEESDEKENPHPSSVMAFASELDVNFVSDKSWWRHAFASALAFAPFCYVPAFVLCVADIIVLLTVEHLNRSMNASMITPADLWQSAVLGLLASALSFLLTLWAFWSWLCRLTAFGRVFNKSDHVPDKEEFQQAIDYVASQQKVFAKIWMFASFYVLLPAIPLCFFVLLTSVSAPELTSMHVTNFTLPVWVMVLGGFVCFALTAIACAYTFVVFAVSANYDNNNPQSAGYIAKRSFQLFWRHFSLFAGTSAMVLLANIVITRPMIFWTQQTLELTKLQIGFEICWQVWFAIASVVLWSLSLAPFCQLVKNASSQHD